MVLVFENTNAHTLPERVQPTGSRVEPPASLFFFFNSSSDSNVHLSVEKRTGVLKLGGGVSESLGILVRKKRQNQLHSCGLE